MLAVMNYPTLWRLFLILYNKKNQWRVFLFCFALFFAEGRKTSLISAANTSRDEEKERGILRLAHSSDEFKLSSAYNCTN